jgi:hypothetical protein
MFYDKAWCQTGLQPLPELCGTFDFKIVVHSVHGLPKFSFAVHGCLPGDSIRLSIPLSNPPKEMQGSASELRCPFPTVQDCGVCIP